MKKIIEIEKDFCGTCLFCDCEGHCILDFMVDDKQGPDCPGPGKHCMMLLNENDLNKLEILLNEIPITKWRKDTRVKIKKIIGLLGLEGLKDEQPR